MFELITEFTAIILEQLMFEIYFNTINITAVYINQATIPVLWPHKYTALSSNISGSVFDSSGAQTKLFQVNSTW